MTARLLEQCSLIANDYQSRNDNQLQGKGKKGKKKEGVKSKHLTLAIGPIIFAHEATRARRFFVINKIARDLWNC